MRGCLVWPKNIEEAYLDGWNKVTLVRAIKDEVKDVGDQIT